MPRSVVLSVTGMVQTQTTQLFYIERYACNYAIFMQQKVGGKKFGSAGN